MLIAKSIIRTVFACHVQKHCTIGYSPFFLVYSIEPKLPGDYLPPFIKINEQEPNESIVVKGRVPEAHHL